MYNITRKLDYILEKSMQEKFLSQEEIIYLLNLTETEDLDNLFKAAQTLRLRHFSNRIFLYGFVYFSTWCRNDCAFCFYRKSNVQSKRYRKSHADILNAAVSLADSGVHLIDLTMGEDAFYYQKRDEINSLAELVQQVKKVTNLPVMISPGLTTKQGLKELSAAGADWYACYQETHNRTLFKQLRIKQSYDQRLLSKRNALNNGLLIEEGILVGVGETSSDIAHSMKVMHDLNANQVRVMSFVPQEGSSMSSWPTPNRILELKVIAILRLLFPNRLIPASLDVDGFEGLQARINAGANVVTSLIPPSLGLAGVAQNTKDIDEGYRTVQGILPVLEQMGLKAATVEEYKTWVKESRERFSEFAGAEFHLEG